MSPSPAVFSVSLDIITKSYMWTRHAKRTMGTGAVTANTLMGWKISLVVKL